MAKPYIGTPSNGRGLENEKQNLIATSLPRALRQFAVVGCARCILPVLVAASVVLAAACSGSNETSPTPTARAADTPLPPTATATQSPASTATAGPAPTVKPTSTPVPTPAATATTTPTATPVPTATPTAAAQTTPEPVDIADLARSFVELLENEDFAVAFERFDPAMKDAVPEAKLAETWLALKGQVGAFISQSAARVESVQGFEVALVRAEFEATPLDIKVVFDGERRVAGLFFQPAAPDGAYEPPDYADPDTFTEEDVIVGSNQWQLPGTLTVPVGNGPFPAVVLVHGSGPNDRDETVGPNKPFKDLAWGLASRGIAVLRYDKRTMVHGQQIAALEDGFTVREETVDDVVAAVSLLRNTPTIDAERIVVLGHSLGGMLVPRVAALDPEIAGFVIMAGPTKPIEDLLLEQTLYVASLDGVVSEAEQATLDQLTVMVEQVKALPENAPATEYVLGAPAPYWLDLRDYDPVAAAVDIARPTLVLHGGRDYQVPPDQLEQWRKGLSPDNAGFWHGLCDPGDGGCRQLVLYKERQSIRDSVVRCLPGRRGACTTRVVDHRRSRLANCCRGCRRTCAGNRIPDSGGDAPPSRTVRYAPGRSPYRIPA